MHTTMQTLGRVAIIGGGLLVSLLKLFMLRGVQNLPQGPATSTYVTVYKMAIDHPARVDSGRVAGDLAVQPATPAIDRNRTDRKGSITSSDEPFRATDRLTGGFSEEVLHLPRPRSRSVWRTSGSGRKLSSRFRWRVIITMLWRLLREMEPSAANTLLGTAIIIFVFRALPGPGPGQTWWMIDC